MSWFILFVALVGLICVGVGGTFIAYTQREEGITPMEAYGTALLVTLVTFITLFVAYNWLGILGLILVATPIVIGIGIAIDAEATGKLVRAAWPSIGCLVFVFSCYWWFDTHRELPESATSNPSILMLVILAVVTPPCVKFFVNTSAKPKKS